MAVSVIAVPRALRAGQPEDEAKALASKLNEGVHGRLVQLLPSASNDQFLLAVFENGE
jgi:hypothetical protein